MPSVMVVRRDLDRLTELLHGIEVGWQSGPLAMAEQSRRVRDLMR
jgi:hypothetical protein